MKNAIVVSHLVKRYRKAVTNAVDDISFTVKEGEFFTLLGPNGAGKTTTIAILTTTLSKTSGSVAINGFDTEEASKKVRQSVGIIFQNPSLDPNLTAEENIRFHVVLYNLYPFRPAYSLMPESYKQLVAELSSVLGLENDMNKAIKTFSGGMKRKLEIIRSLMHRPKVLFLDEPTIGLDPISRRDLWKYIQNIRKKQPMTLLLTTHYLEEAEYSDHTCIINKGKIIAYGTPQDIKQKLVKEYLLLDGVNKKDLVSDLDRLKLRHEKSPRGFKVYITKNRIQEVIANIKTRLSTIEIHTPTLEDAYLSIIEADHERA